MNDHNDEIEQRVEGHKDANDAAAAMEPHEFRKLVEEKTAAAKPYHNPDVWGKPTDLRRMWEKPPPKPDDLIHGVAFKGGKIYLAAPSKARKTFIQIQLALCVATGRQWMGHDITPGRVLYLNFELIPWSFQNRAYKVADKMGIGHHDIPAGAFTVWNLKGKKVSIEKLEEKIEKDTRGDFDLIIFDPLYKMLGERSENDSGEMGELLTMVESIGHRKNSAVFIATHFAKGNQAFKESMDRAVGSGVIGRDGDAILTLTPHAVDDCFTLETTVRDHAPVEPRVLRWEHPLYTVDHGLDAADLKQPKGKAGAASKPLQDTPETALAVFLSLLTDKAQGRKTLATKLSARPGYTARKADALIEGIVSEFSLYELTTEEGVKDCGKFYASRERTGWLFRIKP